MKYFYNYMKECSIHGLNHATFENLRLIERIFWLVAFVISLIVCGFMIKDLHQRYINAPVAVSFDGDLQNVKNVSVTD